MINTKRKPGAIKSDFLEKARISEIRYADDVIITEKASKNYLDKSDT